VEFAGPPGSVESTYCSVKAWNALMVLMAATSTAVARNCGSSTCQNVFQGVAPSICAASRSSGGMPAMPASQIIMKNGMTAQSCTRIMQSGARKVSDSQRISVTPWNQPISDVMMPFGCNNIRQMTATTTTGGRTGRKKIAFSVLRPGKTWSNNSAASKDEIQTGMVVPATKMSVLRSAVRNRSSPSKARKLSMPTHSGGFSRS